MYKKGNIPWNYSPLNTVKIKCATCGKIFKTKRRDKKTVKYCSQSCCAKKRFSIPKNNNFFGKKHTDETKKIIGKVNKGNKYRFKEGKWLSEGYIYTMAKGHPFARKGYILEHRLVMENYLRKHEPNHPALIEIKGIKYLRPKWIVHHDGTKYPMGSLKNRGDNRLKNLKLFPDPYSHRLYHIKIKKNKG